MIGVIDYGSGNFQSVCNALEYLELDFTPVKDPSEFEKVSHLILPGVGAFGDCMGKLESMNLVDPLKEFIKDKSHFLLGICVGMQVLSTLGTEFKETKGFNIVPGKVVKIPDQNQNIVVPHIGWNKVIYSKESKLFEGISNEEYFYFVHSYYFQCKDNNHVSSYCEYGEKITASVESDNVFGLQFHPEKSQINGLKVLLNFSKVTGS